MHGILLSCYPFFYITGCQANYPKTRPSENAKQNELKHCMRKIKIRKTNKTRRRPFNWLTRQQKSHGFCPALTYTILRVRCINYMKFTNKLRACKRRTQFMMFFIHPLAILLFLYHIRGLWLIFIIGM